MNYLTKVIQYLKSLMGIFNIHYRGELHHQNTSGPSGGFKADKANIKSDVMKTFRVSSDSIRRTNRQLIDRGVNIQEVSYSGTITTRVMVDGQERIHSFSEEKIREAYSKTLQRNYTK